MPLCMRRHTAIKKDLWASGFMYNFLVYCGYVKYQFVETVLKYRGNKKKKLIVAHDCLVKKGAISRIDYALASVLEITFLFFN